MNLQAVLTKHLGGDNWQLSKPPTGLSKESFIARSGEHIVFLKLDADTSCLERLSELHITPKILASGKEQNISYIIQEYSLGTHPDSAWFIKSSQKIGELIKKYHDDPVLKTILLNEGKTSTAQEQIVFLQKEIDDLSSLPSITVVKHVLEQLKETLVSIQSQDLVPVHADPNVMNILVHGENIHIVDWDDITLSDPLRDVGLIAYWYLPKTLWDEFLNAAGISLKQSAYDRLYWWVGARSLAIYLWFVRRGSEKAGDYLEDAQAAIARSPNPHAKF